MNVIKDREEEIKKLMQEKLKSYDFTEDDLTQDELSELREEVVAELNGKTVLDGVLFSIPLYSKKRGKE